MALLTVHGCAVLCAAGRGPAPAGVRSRRHLAAAHADTGGHRGEARAAAAWLRCYRASRERAAGLASEQRRRRQVVTLTACQKAACAQMHDLAAIRQFLALSAVIPNIPLLELSGLVK